MSGVRWVSPPPEDDDTQPPAHLAPSRPRRRFGRWLARAVFVVLAVVLLATTVAVVKVLPLRSTVPETTSYSRRAGAEPIAPVDAIAVSSWVFVAVLASEDQGFASHRGIDAAVTRDLVGRALDNERTRGGSTISQQLTRNLWLTPDRSWVRKGTEAWLALWVDRLLDKARQLELYVNLVDWGQGTFGVCAASWRFFAMPPSRLSQEQAALLVTALPDPARRDPGTPTALHENLATGLVIRMQTTPGYHNTTVLETVGLPLDPVPAVAEHPCDRPPLP